MLVPEPAWISNFRHALLRMETLVAAGSLLLLLALIFGQVLARNFFDSSIPSADILSRYLVLYVTFFGAALAVDYDKHIRLDVIAACLPLERCRKFRPPLYLISAVVCAIFAWAAGRFWYDDWQYVAEHERWASILALVTPLGFGLLSLNFLLSGLFAPRSDVPAQ
jgi:TRAP-type C4-dicarboxylate transport system permease small subunit